MPYKATTNVYGKRLIKAGEIITDSEYNSLSAVPRNRFVFLDPDPAPNPEAGQTADAGQPSAVQSIQGNPTKDPDIVTSNPDREYLNDAAKAKRAKQNKNK